MVQDVTRPYGCAPRSAMQALLFSIAPLHADRIFGRLKLWEFRRICPKVESGTTALVYETRPRMAVTGTFTIGEVRLGSPAQLAALESDVASSLAAYHYLAGGSRPAALQVINACRFEIALPISALDLLRPPQSYAWVTHPNQAI